MSNIRYEFAQNFTKQTSHTLDTLQFADLTVSHRSKPLLTRIHRHTGAHRGTQGFTGIHRDSQGHTGAHKSTQGLTGAHQGSQGCTGKAYMVESAQFRLIFSSTTVKAPVCVSCTLLSIANNRDFLQCTLFPPIIGSSVETVVVLSVSDPALHCRVGI